MTWRTIGDVNSDLVERAIIIARKIERRQKGKGVSSPMVWSKLKKEAETDRHLAQRLREADPRWMGAVFSGKEWYRLAYTSERKQGGSHGRPVAVWIRQPDLFSRED